MRIPLCSPSTIVFFRMCMSLLPGHVCASTPGKCHCLGSLYVLRLPSFTLFRNMVQASCFNACSDNVAQCAEHTHTCWVDTATP